MLRRASAIGLVLVCVSSPRADTPLPTPARGIAVSVVVGSAGLDSTSRLFTYRYRVANPPANAEAIGSFAIDVTRGPREIELSREGLSNGPRHLGPSSEAAFQRVPMVPVGVASPEGWLSGLDASAGAPAAGAVRWTASDPAARVAPGQAVDGFQLSSRGLPAIRLIELGDGRTVRMWTVGPKAPPQQLVRGEFLDALIAVLDECRQLGWISAAGAHHSIRAKLTTAKRRMETGDGTGAGDVLNAFLDEVRAGSCHDFHCRGTEPLTNEAYAVLFFNGQFLLERLPGPYAPSASSGWRVQAGTQRPDQEPAQD